MEENHPEEHLLDDIMGGFGFQPTIWKVQVAVLFVLFALGFAGNTSVLVMLIRNRLAVNRTIRQLILNLVIADFCVAIFCILTMAIWHYTLQWLGGDFLCRMSKYMQMFSLYASTFIITVIAIDRCIAVTAPMRKIDSPKCTTKMIIIAWILAALFSIPQVQF